MVAIRTKELTKEFGGVTAVDNITLSVKENEIFGLLGPNGAGKSTLLNVLLDFLKPTSGEATILGHDPWSESREVRERIGVLPERYGFYDRLTAREHLQFALDVNESSSEPETILNRVGLTENGNQKVGRFSKGMRQRLALGVSLVDEPELLLLDEPSSGFDPAGVERIERILQDERDRGVTVLLLSHNMQLVESVCNRVGLMNDSELLTVGTIEELRSRNNLFEQLVVSFKQPPTDTDISAIEGVRNVSKVDSSLRITCSDTRVKKRLISYFLRSDRDVTDIDVEAPKLEGLFVETVAGHGEGGES